MTKAELEGQGSTVDCARWSRGGGAKVQLTGRLTEVE